MSDDLLPCPFCGGDDIHVLSVNRRDKSRLYPFVRCMGCYLDLPGENEDYSSEGKTAIAAWNRRAIPATDAREAALREAATKIIQKRIETILAEEGSQEPDTGEINLPEWAQTAVAELEGILAALEGKANE